MITLINSKTNNSLLQILNFLGPVFMRSYLAKIYSVQLNLMSPNQTHTWVEESLKYSTTRAQHGKSKHERQHTFRTSNSWKMSHDRPRGILNVSNFVQKFRCHLSYCVIITPHSVQQTFSMDYCVHIFRCKYLWIVRIISAVNILPLMLESVGW